MVRHDDDDDDIYMINYVYVCYVEIVCIIYVNHVYIYII